MISAPNEPPTARAATTPASPGLRIFLVENDADTRRIFGMLLERMGHSVRSVETLADALAELATARYDVLIADIGLSDGTGWDLLRLMREDNIPQPPYAIAMSGFGMSADRTRSLSEGYREHFVKPIDTRRLFAALEQARQGRDA